MLNSPVLVVLAAGMGSRYGGLKQIDKMDESGNTLINFSLFDAHRAGFKDVLFIIRHDIEDDFMSVMNGKTVGFDNVDYVYQDLDNLPVEIPVPLGRIKPYGTAHALYCCAQKLKGKSFITINADDFYGYGAYKLAFEFLSAEKSPNIHALIGYEIASTLSENGHVSRGVCITDENATLVRIDERKKVKLMNGEGYYTLDDGKTYSAIPRDAVSSMNMWAFNCGFMDEFALCFPERLKNGLAQSPLNFEETITDAVKITAENLQATIKVLSTDEKWFGVTYQEDKSLVKKAIEKLKSEGKYPDKLY